MTSIVDMTSGVTLKAWLCSACIATRKTVEGGAWSVKVLGEVDGRCDDCDRARQVAPGYVTPAVDYVPTAPGSFCPPPGWTAPKPMAAWPKPARKGRAQQEPITEEEAA